MAHCVPVTVVRPTDTYQHPHLSPVELAAPGSLLLVRCDSCPTNPHLLRKNTKREWRDREGRIYGLDGNHFFQLLPRTRGGYLRIFVGTWSSATLYHSV